MKALTVEFDLIVQSMRDLSRDTNDYYLCRLDGKVISLSRSLIRSLSTDSADDRAPLPEWDTQMIPLARKIVLMGSTDYLRIPEAFGRPEHRWMMEFSGEIPTVKVRERLFSALRGRGSCHRFKEILKEQPEDWKKWSHFSLKRWQERIQHWLEDAGIIAIEENPKQRAAAR